MAHMSIDFKGWELYLKKLEEVGERNYVGKIATECLEESFDIYTKELEQAWQPHNNRFSGNTGRQILKKARISGTPNGVYSTPAGFQINQHTKEGMPSIYVAYGTPTTNPPDIKLRNVMQGKTTKARIRRKHQQIFERAIMEKMK